MTAILAWSAAIGPLALLTVALVPNASRARYAPAAALGAFGVAVLAAIAVVLAGSIQTPELGVAGIGIGLYLDRLSATMFCLVSFIGFIVVRYSRDYLDGDPAQGRFIKRLCLTIAAVLTLIIAGTMPSFLIGWIATSLGLHALLVFYPERAGAIIAARKKWLATRLGDLTLIAACVLIYARFGSLDYAVVFAGAETMNATGIVPAGMHVAGVLLVITALLKSAQFPLHGWLVEVMETPTPVSAVLHAGIINAGGFLVLRFAHIVGLSTPALEILVLVGGFTALFGSVVMLTQTSIKSSLAYSTIAQMGFMMLECGLGAFPAALLHIVAHSLYKAHAFLSSGSVIDIARASWTPSPGGNPHPARLLVAIGVVLAIAFAVGRVFGITLTEQPGAFALGAALLLGLIHFVAKAIDEHSSVYVVTRVLAAAVLVAIAYFGLQVLMERLYAGSLPHVAALRDPLGISVVVVVIGSFAAVTFLQGIVPVRAVRPRWEALYAHLSNGLYVNTFINRVIVRAWPRRSVR
jgi:NAD(P)H-quinone oxidoreductase subunit 5